MVNEDYPSGSTELGTSSNEEKRNTYGTSLEDFVRLCVHIEKIIRMIFACMLEVKGEGAAVQGNWLTVFMGEGQMGIKYGTPPRPRYTKAAGRMMRHGGLLVGSTLYSQLGEVVGAVYDAWRMTSKDPNMCVEVIVSIGKDSCKVYRVVKAPQERTEE